MLAYIFRDDVVVNFIADFIFGLIFKVDNILDINIEVEF